MRIIAGEARGRKISVPPVHDVRPTLDRVREALFSVLHGMLWGKEVLDLFAGSGSLGIEALSRGANHAVFIDRHWTCLRTIAENLRMCNLKERGTLFHGMIPECFLELREKYKNKYDIVFLDPPYQMAFDRNILKRLHGFSLLQEDAKIIIEHSRRKEIDSISENFILNKKRIYGEVAITLLTYQQ
jgi:16S rRNA (guanine966-N2)-methyltransferase